MRILKSPCPMLKKGSPMKRILKSLYRFFFYVDEIVEETPKPTLQLIMPAKRHDGKTITLYSTMSDATLTGQYHHVPKSKTFELITPDGSTNVLYRKQWRVERVTRVKKVTV